MPRHDSRKRRLRLSFGLRHLFVTSALVAVTSGWCASQRRQSTADDRIAQQLEKQGARIGYHFPFTKDGIPLDQQSSWRTALSDLLGPRLDFIFMRNTTLSDLTAIGECTAVKRLFVGGTKVRDIGPLSKLPRLVELDLMMTKVADLTPLADAKHLETLYLQGAPVSTLKPLYCLKSLRTIYVRGTLLTAAELREFSAAVPKCRIVE